MKKILFILLSFLPFTLNAEEYNGTTGDCTWHLDTDTGVLTISGTGDMQKGRRVSPYNDLSADIKKVVVEDGVLSIGDYAFYYCTELTSIELPPSVTEIGDCAFYYCTELASIEVPSSVTKIGYYAFCSCVGITSIVFPSGLTDIGGFAFASCSGLTSISIPSNVNSIGEGAFSYCSGITSISVDNNNPYYHDGDGNNCIVERSSNTLIAGCKSSKIPSNVTGIGDGAFAGCSGLSFVNIPSGVTSIGEGAFNSCSGLTSIIIPSSVESIGGWAFQLCEGLKNVIIEEGVTSIGYYAFASCYELSSIEIPSSVTTIGEYAILSCPKLTSLTIPTGVTTIGNYAFCNNTGLSSITIPSSVSSIGYGVFSECSGLISLNVDDANPYYTDGGEVGGSNCIIETSSHTLIAGIGTTIIPSTVTSIGSYAFYNCIGLTSINIPSSVSTIGGRAFYGTGLTSVVLPPYLTDIGVYAFDACNNLNSVISYSKKPFTVGNYYYPFGNSNPDRILYVPSGTRDAYIAAGCTETVFGGGIIEMPMPSAQLSTYFETVNPLSKAATLSIGLENDGYIIMSDFYIHLPDGIEIATDGDGEYDVTLNPDRIDDHVVEIRKNSQGAYHFICYSPTNSPFKGTEGELMSVNLAYDKNEIVGEYEGTISSILFSDTNLLGVYADDVSINMEFLDYLMGDVNADLRINGIDIVEMVDNIMERPSFIFIKRAGDFDKNDIINGLDLVAEVNLVLAQMVDDYVKARRSPSLGLELADNLLTLHSGDGQVVMDMASSDRYILAQYTLQLSDGMTLRDITSDADHIVACQSLGDNRYTVLCYSMYNKPFVANDNMMGIHVSGDGSVTVTDVMFVDIDRQPCWVGSATTQTATDIVEINGSFRKPVNIYSLNGVLVRENVLSTEGLGKGIYIINGKKYMKR